MNWLTVTDGDKMFLMFHYVRRHVTGLISCELACPSAPLGDKYLCWCVNCDFQCGDGAPLRLLISSGLTFSMVSQMVLVVKDLPANAGNLRGVGSVPRWGLSPGEGNGKPTPVFLPGKSYVQRNLVGYIPWGCKESDMTEYVDKQREQSL